MRVIVQVTNIEYDLEPEDVLDCLMDIDPEDATETPVDEAIEEIRKSLPTELCLERSISLGALVDYILDRKSEEDVSESESDGLWELEDAIACGIADETGYLVDNYSYEITEVEGEKLEL